MGGSTPETAGRTRRTRRGDPRARSPAGAARRPAAGRRHPPALDAVLSAFAAGTGPVAIDAERASGYRYSARAYLVQLRREGSGTALVDPIAFDDLEDLRRGARRHRVDPARRHPGPRLPRRGRPAAHHPVRHRARRPAARLPPGRPGHAGRDHRRPPPAQGALRGRLVDPAAARAVAGVRRPRRRGARRAARGARPRARGDRQGRVGPPGVRAPRQRRAARPPPGPVAPHLGHAPGPRPPRPGRRQRAVGDPRRDRRPPRRDPRPDHPGLGDRRGRQRDAPRQGVPAVHQGLPRPRRRALREPVGRGAARRPHDARRRAAPRRRTVRRTAAAPRLGRP